MLPWLVVGLMWQGGLDRKHGTLSRIARLVQGEGGGQVDCCLMLGLRGVCGIAPLVGRQSGAGTRYWVALAQYCTVGLGMHCTVGATLSQATRSKGWMQRCRWWRKFRNPMGGIIQGPRQPDHALTESNLSQESGL